MKTTDRFPISLPAIAQVISLSKAAREQDRDEGGGVVVPGGGVTRKGEGMKSRTLSLEDNLGLC